MTTYKFAGETRDKGVWRDGISYIPQDNNNAQWQVFTQWEAEGNTADPFESAEESVASRIEGISMQRMAMLSAGFTFGEYTFRTDTISLVLLFACVLMVILGMQTEQDFECEGNQWIHIDNTNAGAILTAGVTFIQNVYAWSKEQQDNINS